MAGDAANVPMPDGSRIRRGKESIMRNTLITLFALGAIALLPSAASAGGWERGGGWRGDGWRGGGWRGGHSSFSIGIGLGFGGFGGTYRDCSGYHFSSINGYYPGYYAPQYYAPPPVVVYPAPVVTYSAPPVVYSAPPVVYSAPPVVVYPAAPTCYTPSSYYSVGGYYYSR